MSKVNKKNWLVLIILIASLGMYGCASKQKSSVMTPELAVNPTVADVESTGSDTSSPSTVANTVTTDTLNAIAGSSGTNSFLGVSSAPAYGAPVISKGPFGLGQDDFNTTPDADLFYTVSDITEFKNRHPRWDWATTLTAKTKAIDANNKDIAGAWLLGTRIRPVTQPINIIDVINGEDAKRKAEFSIDRKFDTTSYPWTSLANGVTVTVTITHIATNWVGTAVIKGIDAFIADGRWLHQMTVDYTGSGGKTAHFDLVRDNDINSTTYGYHTGDGTVSDSAGIIAKVHLNGDGTGYYTLAKENYATQYTFTEGDKRWARS